MDEDTALPERTRWAGVHDLQFWGLYFPNSSGQSLDLQGILTFQPWGLKPMLQQELRVGDKEGNRKCLIKGSQLRLYIRIIQETS